MTGHKTPLTARQAVFEALRGLNVKKHDVGGKLNKLLPRTNQRGRTTDIVCGVVRNLAMLDSLLRRAGDIREKNVKPDIQAILRAGTYELVYTPDTAEHAIIYEAVGIAAARGSKKSAGFVNAVLRGVQRLIENRRADIDDDNARRTIPTQPGCGCLLKEDILPDKSADRAQYLAQAFSLPAWLTAQWTDSFGAETAEQVCLASNRSPSVIAWPNTLKTDAAGLVEILQLADVRTQISTNKKMLRISCTGGIEKLEAFQKGLFYIQDPSAAAAVELLDFGKCRQILDLCAAPGTKTIAAALQMDAACKIIATDRSASRLQMVEQNRRRLGLKNIEIVPPDKWDSLSCFGPFDAVIVDAPCSNSGVLARRLEARWQITETDVKSIARQQKKLLLDALNYLRSGGVALYSTCSILPQENRLLIEEVLAQQTGVYAATGKLTLPAVEKPDAFDHDGAYAALLIKK